LFWPDNHNSEQLFPEYEQPFTHPNFTLFYHNNPLSSKQGQKLLIWSVPTPNGGLNFDGIKKFVFPHLKQPENSCYNLDENQCIYLHPFTKTASLFWLTGKQCQNSELWSNLDGFGSHKPNSAKFDQNSLLRLCFHQNNQFSLDSNELILRDPSSLESDQNSLFWLNNHNGEHSKLHPPWEVETGQINNFWPCFDDLPDDFKQIHVFSHPNHPENSCYILDEKWCILPGLQNSTKCTIFEQDWTITHHFNIFEFSKLRGSFNTSCQFCNSGTPNSPMMDEINQSNTPHHLNRYNIKTTSLWWVTAKQSQNSEFWSNFGEFGSHKPNSSKFDQNSLLPLRVPNSTVLSTQTTPTPSYGRQHQLPPMSPRYHTGLIPRHIDISFGFYPLVRL